MDKLRSDPMSRKSSVQKRPVNLESPSLMMDLGTPQYFTTCLKNKRAASSVVQSLGAGMKTPDFENRSTTTMRVPYPSYLGKQASRKRAEVKKV